MTGTSALRRRLRPASLRLRVENIVGSVADTAFPAATHVSLAVVFQVREGRLQVLVWQRERDPFTGAYALPGELAALGKVA